MKYKPRLIAYMNAYSQGKSGGDMVYIEIAKRQDEFENVIITSKLGENLCRENNINAIYKQTSYENKFKNILFIYVLRTLRAFALDLKLKPTDVLLGTSDFFPDVLPIAWLKLNNKKSPWLQHIFHLIPKKRRLAYISQAISLFFIKHMSDLIVTDNLQLKKELVGYGFNADKIQVNYPGIPTLLLRSIKKQKKIKFDAVFMAQLRTAKGIFDLIDVWKLVMPHKADARLGIIGKGDEGIMYELSEQIKKHQLEKNIKLLGFLEDKEAFSLIRNSSIFIFPSHEEGFGIAPLEAQYLGVPVIAWDIPVYKEIFPKGMIKVKLHDIPQFAQEILDLLANKTKHQKISIDAKSNAKRFDWVKTVKIEQQLMHKLIS